MCILLGEEAPSSNSFPQPARSLQSAYKEQYCFELSANIQQSKRKQPKSPSLLFLLRFPLLSVRMQSVKLVGVDCLRQELFRSQVYERTNYFGKLLASRSVADTTCL